MSIKKVGWCRNTEELVLDVQILDIPYLRDDLDVYSFTQQKDGPAWIVWKPETQNYRFCPINEVPEVVQVAMMMLS